MRRARQGALGGTGPEPRPGVEPRSTRPHWPGGRGVAVRVGGWLGRSWLLRQRDGRGARPPGTVGPGERVTGLLGARRGQPVVAAGWSTRSAWIDVLPTRLDPSHPLEASKDRMDRAAGELG